MTRLLRSVDSFLARNEGRLVRIAMVFVVLAAIWFAARSVI